jgi:hypothetical protein
MTEYITKEQAMKLVDTHIPAAQNGDIYDEFHRAINLAFEQGLEVVGHAFSGTLSVLKVIGDGSIYVEKDLSEHQDTPLYALKGDSK